MLCMTNAMCLYFITYVQSAQAEQVSTDAETLIPCIAVALLCLSISY